VIGIGLNWAKAHKYECATVDDVRVIRPVGAGRAENFDPFKIKVEMPLYLRFVRLDGSEEACLKFAHAYGLLTTQSPKEAEPLKDWQKEIRNVKGLMDMLQADHDTPGGILRINRARPVGVEIPLRDINATLVQGERDIEGNIGRPKLLLKPKSLRDAMFLQLGKFVAGDGLLRICPQCGNPFEGATKSRRSHAIYCSRACKDRASYEKWRAAQ
jgi:hypothetical protein